MRLVTSRAGQTVALLVIAGAIIASCAVPTASAQFLAMPARVNAANPADQKAPEFLKSLINVELSFLKRACEPSDEQMRRLVEGAKEAHQKMGSILQGAPNPAGVAFRRHSIHLFGPNNERLVENPYQRVRKDVAKCAKAILDDDQHERYLKEAATRSRFEKQVAVDIVLELVDEKVVLTAQQREQLSEKMMSGWEGLGVVQLQRYLNDSQYVPNGATEFLSEVLTAKQLAVWRTHRAVSFAERIQVVDDSGLGEEWIK
jgi:hypothetical protein